jgi:triacylglycerol lipase
MSFLVEMDRDRYPPHALDAFNVSKLDLRSRKTILDTGRAMMWLSQLAYETANPDKIRDILPTWGLAQRALIDNPPDTRLPLTTACAIVAGGRGATIVAFSGTDPLKIGDWITDFSVMPSSAGIHTGFADASGQIWPRISTALANRPPAERSVFFTGHSLGGALAIVAAARASRELGVRPAAVFTYGSPRPGDAQFANAYPAALGDATFRFVHGTDMVATVGPSFVGFRHVGRCIQCASDGHFDETTPMLARDDDKPEFFDSLFASGTVALRKALEGKLFDPVGPGALGRVFGLLPQQIRDHLPPNYLRALAPPSASAQRFDEPRRQGHHRLGGSMDLAE